MSTMKNTAYVRDGKFTPGFDDLVKKKLEKWDVPGVSIAVIQNEDVCAKGYGFAKLPDKPVTPETLFNCASMTKAFTAAAISFLVDDDERFPDVKWDTPMSRLIGDDFVLRDGRYTEEVTVEDILSHRSGLPDCDDAFLGIFSKNTDTPKSVTRKLRHIPLVAPLRTEHIYCNAGYVTIAHLIETLTGQWMGDFLRERIWEPLSMENTFYGPEDAKKHGAEDKMATCYRWDEKEGKHVEMPWCEQPEGSGCGEMVSNVLDYAKFLKCMINRSPPFSEHAHKELVKPRIIDDPDGETKPWRSYRMYALGWEIEDFHGERIIGHDGSVPGFECKMKFIPRLNWGVVAFGNKIFDKAIDGLVWGLVDDFLGVEEGKRFDWDEEMEMLTEKMKPEKKEELFPKVPEPKIPLSRLLEEYAGVYKHPGFGMMEVEVKDGKLQVDCMERTWRFMLHLEHVSGEFFFVEKIEYPQVETSTLRAQFKISVDGTVRAFAIELIEGLEEDDGFIWFQRDLAA